MPKKEEKIDVGWIDQFNENFRFIRGAVDVAAAALGYEAPVQPASIAPVLEEVLRRLNKLDDLVQGFWLQVRGKPIVERRAQ
jgi:hypothetical protein